MIEISEQVDLVLAPNPGPMTLEGTNTWIIRASGSDEALVIDAGPLDEAHLQAIIGAAEDRGARVTATITTHRHFDHAEGVPRLGELTGCQARTAAEFSDGEIISVGGRDIEVIATPGHTADSVSFLLRDERLIFTGDTVLGRGTTVVAEPDGDLAAYLASLDRLAAVVETQSIAKILPGHGPVVTDPAGALATYRNHRKERLSQVERALAAGAAADADPVEGVLRRVYADVPEAVWPAARQSIRAQLAYLNATNEGRWHNDEAASETTS